jgi:hypothetical protein
MKRLTNTPALRLGAGVGTVGVPSAGLVAAGHPTAAALYGAITTIMCVTLEFWLQRQRDAAIAAVTTITPKDLVVYEAVKTGLIDSADLTAYLTGSSDRTAARGVEP